MESSKEINPENLELIIHSVWCTWCGKPTTMINYSMEKLNKGMVFHGQCKRCKRAVARHLEGEEG